MGLDSQNKFSLRFFRRLSNSFALEKSLCTRLQICETTPGTTLEVTEIVPCPPSFKKSKEENISLIDLERTLLNHKIQFEIKNYQKLLENLISNSTSYGNDFNINQLSAALSLPISYVSLIFKYYSIYTIVELKHLLRIREAKKLIQINKGQLSLKQVSELVGYKVYSSFYREYLKYDSKT